MCGIVAVFSREDSISERSLKKATLELKHRGPDHQNHWIDARDRVGLGHARLSIIDLDTGAQPISNEDKTIHIIVTGEFYDFERIRKNLQCRGHIFRTKSDSEIALHLYEEFGVQCLSRLRGEFAFVIWDEVNEIFFAARDRFGIKPLFYSIDNKRISFSSEAKALFALGLEPQWDYEAFYQQIFCYLPQDRSLFKGVRQVPPGHAFVATRSRERLIRYWDLDYPSERADCGKHSEAEYIENFRYVLDESIRLRLRADVPVGCFLSGGVDSSSILGIAATHNKNVKAFTVAFNQKDFDECQIAQETASQAGVDFDAIPLDEGNFAEHLEDSVWHGEMLAINAHGVARYLQSKAVHNAGYKVVLSGDGADDILAGYVYARQDLMRNGEGQKNNSKHQGILQAMGTRNGQSQNLIPTALRQVQKTLGFVPSWLKEIATSRSVLHPLLSPSYAAEFSKQNVYSCFLGQFDIEGQMQGRERVLQSMYLWCKSILPNYSLFAERLEMAHGLEVRIPFLDHKVFEMVRELPMNLLIRGLKEKYILREAAKPFLTQTVYERVKHPFTAPPITLNKDNKLYELMCDTFHSSCMSSVPFFEQKTILSLLETLPYLNSATRLKLDSIFLMILCTCLLQNRYRL